MGEVPPLTQLFQQYRQHDFQFFIVYTREAHPGEHYPHHDSLEQKIAHARRLRQLDRVDEIPILVDDVGGATHTAYGQLPNMVYVIGRDGKIAYKSDWTDTQELDGMCASLLRLDEMKARNTPILRQGLSQRLHWIAMEPAHREKIYRRAGEKAIKDYQQARGLLPYASDAEAAKK